MIYINTISGGKDSEATEIWACENLPKHETVFCDTGWESPKTYLHIKSIEEFRGGANYSSSIKKIQILY